MLDGVNAIVHLLEKPANNGLSAQFRCTAFHSPDPERSQRLLALLEAVLRPTVTP